MENNLPQIEEKILKFWEKERIFEKSISQRKGSPYFSFYDGPPFATGKPHYGHILATAIKDTVLRYWTMRGYQVPRRVGWDCHGLPVENLIEKELNIKNKRGIEDYGIEKFNHYCRLSVFRCVEDFENTLKRVGRWGDYKKAYATLDNNYIESVWWVLKQLWNQGLVYKDYRVSPYCPRCGTPLSNFEVNLGYKQTKDPSIFVKFPILDFQFSNSYFLVWTTTPWTLPANFALAISSQAQYILVNQGKENYLLAKERKEILRGDWNLVKEFSGKELINLKYKPIFGHLISKEIQNIENAFRVLPADFISLEEGTGVVHIAPMYGEEDFKLGKRFNLPKYHTIDDAGNFKEEIKEFSGKFVKQADNDIIKNLEQRNFLYQKGEIIHSYPFCWRCDNPLLYYAFESWFVAVTKFKKELIKNNKRIRWVPDHIKEGRFGNWLKEAKDWNFSRNRFWGAPIPIWQCQSCNSYKCIGSFKELGKEIKDAHRPYIDKVFLECEKCKGKMKRVPEVFDCWFESGSMPYAQWHYPFENKKLVEQTFPADFIAEGLDQTRGWFYTLHVLATALTLKNIGLGKSKPAFKNVIVNGLILDEQGRKLSKKLRNYPEVGIIFNAYGADSLRYFLLASTSIGDDYRFSEKGIEAVWRKLVLTILNIYNFFETYKGDNFKPAKNFLINSLLDKWIISLLQRLNDELIYYMDRYQITKAARLFLDFVDDFSNWYIRRSRKRDFSRQLHYLLFLLSKLIAPFLPFLSEEIYQKLKNKKDPKSVHLCDYPLPNKKLINKRLEEKMRKIREIATRALSERARKGIKVRQPLRELVVNDYTLIKDKELLELIKEEVNVKKISFGKDFKLDTEITPELKEEGVVRDIIRQIQELRKQNGFTPKDKISVFYQGDDQIKEILVKNQGFIQKETFAQKIISKNLKEGLKTKKELIFEKMKLYLAIARYNLKKNK